MRKPWAALPILAVLAACGDPLSGIERVSDLSEPLPEAPVAAALPEPVDVDARTPVLAGLFRRKTPRQAPDPAIEAALREANGLPPVVDTEMAVAGAPVEAVPPVETVARAPITEPERSGILSWLRRGASTEKDVQTLVDKPVETAVAMDLGPVETTPVAEAAEEEVAQELELASLEPVALPPERASRRGVFGLRRGGALVFTKPKTRAGPDGRDVPLGAVLPFGEIARVCDAKAPNLGTIVAKAARKGRAYVLYDSAPDSAYARTFYVTGFADNCPRQFTAAIALFGAPELHEQLRYGLPAGDFPYSATDEAYEKVKARVCNVSRKKPCGSRISRLEKTTTFVSVYENFGENARWSDILLHDGEVLAVALKSP